LSDGGDGTSAALAFSTAELGGLNFSNQEADGLQRDESRRAEVVSKEEGAKTKAKKKGDGEEVQPDELNEEAKFETAYMMQSPHLRG
jgi:hypothetical protein